MRLTSTIDSANATTPETDLRVRSHRWRDDEPTLKMILEDEPVSEGGRENVEPT